MLRDDGQWQPSPPPGLLRRIRTPGIHCSIGPILSDQPLTKEEATSIRGSTLARRDRFASSRGLVRALGREVGLSALSVPTSQEGEPVWPAGVRGSFSYKENWCAAALSIDPAHAAIGLDLDRLVDPPPDSWDGVCSERERNFISSVSTSVAVELLFTAKEAYFKAQFVVTRDSNLEHRDVTVLIDHESGHFTAQCPHGGHGCSGSIALMAGWCAATAVIPSS